MNKQNEYQNVCNNIRFLRKKYDLSRTVMAKKLHITIKNLDSMESGIFPQRIRISLLFHVEKSFGISPKEMLDTRLEDGDLL